VKGHTTIIANVCYGFKTTTTGRTRFFFKALVQHLADAPTTVVRVDSNQVNVSGLGRPGSHKPEEKANHDAIMLHYTRERSELIEEDGVGQSAGGASPPTIYDLDDVLKIVFSEGSRDHLCWPGYRFIKSHQGLFKSRVEYA